MFYIVIAVFICIVLTCLTRILPVIRRRCPDCGAHRHWLSGRCTGFHCTQYWTSR